MWSPMPKDDAPGVILNVVVCAAPTGEVQDIIWFVTRLVAAYGPHHDASPVFAIPSKL